MNSKAGSVLFCGAWDDGPGYPRAAGLRQGLERLGVTVRECRVEGLGASKRELLRNPWLWPRLLWRTRQDRKALLKQLRAMCLAEQPRCVVVPYPGHQLVGAIRRASPVPVVLDLFLSAYDTAVEDRRLFRPGSLPARLLRRLDRRACEAADLVLLDTPLNAAYLATLTGLPPERFAWLPLTDPEANGAVSFPKQERMMNVLFFGTGVPLHGLDTLVEAARNAPSVHLTLIGGRQEDRAAARDHLGDRVTIGPDFVDRAKLRASIGEAHVVAGVFGASDKAQRVVPWKLVIALAAGRPVLTADTPAVRGWLDGCGAVFLAPAADPAALAQRLEQLASSPFELERAAAQACAVYDRHFAADRAAARWQQLLERVDEGREGVGA